eukprot:scaffold5460_cov153-Skeletonema_dohrnii-CCMP3373.AAC.21
MGMGSANINNTTSAAIKVGCADILNSRYLKEREVADHNSSVYLLTRERSPGIERSCTTSHSNEECSRMISRIGATFKNHPGQKRIYNYQLVKSERGKTPTVSISHEKEDK